MERGKVHNELRALFFTNYLYRGEMEKN